MLILTRKEQERIVIRDDVVITVTKVQGDKVRLGIEAPEEVSVHRWEVYEKVKASDQPVR
jgi:carbon storage regulator